MYKDIRVSLTTRRNGEDEVKEFTCKSAVMLKRGGIDCFTMYDSKQKPEHDPRTVGLAGSFDEYDGRTLVEGERLLELDKEKYLVTGVSEVPHTTEELEAERDYKNLFWGQQGSPNKRLDELSTKRIGALIRKKAEEIWDDQNNTRTT